MNLAFFGFAIAGLVFAFYALVFFRLAGRQLPVFLRAYAFAYVGLALAFLVWSVAALTPEYLPGAVLAGNALLLAASCSLLIVLFAGKPALQRISFFGGLALSLLFLWFRVQYYAPVPFMADGILIFNTQKPIAMILAAVFILIWLPANLVAARHVTARMATPGMSSVYSFVYAVTTVAAILFITFKTPRMVVASFATLLICFVLLLYSNFIIKKLLPEDK